MRSRLATKRSSVPERDGRDRDAEGRVERCDVVTMSITETCSKGFDVCNFQSKENRSKAVEFEIDIGGKSASRTIRGRMGSNMSQSTLASY